MWHRRECEESSLAIRTLVNQKNDKHNKEAYATVHR
jgi:hypothetical protein